MSQAEEADQQRDRDDEITTEPPDPLAGSDSSVAKVGERLQEQVDEDDGTDGDAGDR